MIINDINNNNDNNNDNIDDNNNNNNAWQVAVKSRGLAFGNRLERVLVR